MAGRWEELKMNLGAMAIWAITSVISHSCRLTTVDMEKVWEYIRSGTGLVLVTWHGRTLIPIHYFRQQKLWTIASLSRDGEYQARILRRLGWQMVRGSTGRGAIRAAVAATRKIKEGGVLAFTPDGPKGPARKLQPGTLFFAQTSQSPIIPLGVSAYPRKLLPTWDSYMIPLPFARAAMVAGDPITIPLDADEAQLAEIAARVEEAIDSVEARAESIVTGRKVCLPHLRDS